MKLRNLTRHNVNVNAWTTSLDHGVLRRTVTIPPDPGGPAFVRFEDKRGHVLPVGGDWNVDVYVRDYYSISGVPAAEPGVFLVVSSPVASHPSLAGRKDILIPNRIVKDSAGRIVGCESFKPGPGTLA